MIQQDFETQKQLAAEAVGPMIGCSVNAKLCCVDYTSGWPGSRTQRCTIMLTNIVLLAQVYHPPVQLAILSDEERKGDSPDIVSATNSDRRVLSNHWFGARSNLQV